MQPFEQVVAEHGLVVLRVCRAMVGANDADDVWTETMVSAMSAYPDLRPDSNVRGWLVTIAHRRSIDLLRRRARRSVSGAQVPDVATLDDLEPVECADDDLYRFLAELPTKQRLAVTYRYLGDLAYTEIGELIDSTATAARRSAADGIAALRSNLLSATAPAAISAPPRPRPPRPAQPRPTQEGTRR